MNRLSVASQMKPNVVVKVLCCCLMALLISSTQSATRYFEPNQVALAQPLIVKWRYQTDQSSNLTPAADKTTVFLPLASGTLIALKATDGKLLWKAEAGGEFSAAPTTDERCIYAATRYSDSEPKHDHGTLRALSK